MSSEDWGKRKAPDLLMISGFILGGALIWVGFLALLVWLVGVVT